MMFLYKRLHFVRLSVLSVGLLGSPNHDCLINFRSPMLSEAGSSGDATDDESGSENRAARSARICERRN